MYNVTQGNHLSALHGKIPVFGNVKLIWQCQINPMRDALKSFYFRKKKVDVRKGIFFLFYQIVMETLFL